MAKLHGESFFNKYKIARDGKSLWCKNKANFIADQVSNKQHAQAHFIPYLVILDYDP